MEHLTSRLDGLCDEQPFTTGWYLRDLRSGREADRGGHVVVPSASTRKVAILAAALQAVHAGRLALDQPVTIQERYQHNNSGCFQHLLPGFTITFRDALVMMIIVSDNTCTGTVADLVGLDAVNALCRAIGMRGTTHRHGIPPADLPRDHPVDYTNATTPADVGLLLGLLLRGADDAATADRLGGTPELCRLALDILSWQKLNSRLPALLPVGTKVAHKTGTGARNYNDAGIVYQGDRPLFILTVYTDGVPGALPDGTPGPAAAGLLIARLGRACWDALKA
ncbi:MAG TPA: serine hydrolase [Thermomicrobiales bacterium]|nr:serine hydrolase [Thermomicrobiales bacterium]